MSFSDYFLPTSFSSLYRLKQCGIVYVSFLTHIANTFCSDDLHSEESPSHANHGISSAVGNPKIPPFVKAHTKMDFTKAGIKMEKQLFALNVNYS